VFLSTVIPGLLLARGYAVLNYFICHLRYRQRQGRAVEPEMTRSSAWGACAGDHGRPARPGLPVVILVGIYGGICTPNEAGAVGRGLLRAGGLFVYRVLTLPAWAAPSRVRSFPIGVIALLIARARCSGATCVRAGVAQHLAELMLGTFDSRFMILLSMNAFLLLMACTWRAIPS
jgi:TRAP-type C4-dicarboxylate transport system permease large subunit